MPVTASEHTYKVNEIFCSPQGEGHRQGEFSVFLRFAGCNLRCKVEPGTRSPGGFDCDTEFKSFRPMTLTDIVFAVSSEWALTLEAAGHARWIVVTGGEPMLQLDQTLCDRLHDVGWKIQIETNGSRKIPADFKLDWITVSPKVAEHAIRQTVADEVKYVRGFGQGIPRSRVRATHHFISPAFNGLDVDQRTLDWCRQLVQENPTWKLSVQMHKILGNR